MWRAAMLESPDGAFPGSTPATLVPAFAAHWMQWDALSILALRMFLPENMDPASDQVRRGLFRNVRRHKGNQFDGNQLRLWPIVNEDRGNNGVY
jgi:hypothetical protein